MTANEDNEEIARKNLLRKSTEIDGIKIEGYDFDKGVDYPKLVGNFSSTGFQASHLSNAIRIINKMISEKAFIYFGYTSNMVSSGLRDIFRWLVKHKKVDVVVTTAGGIEEDIIKCLGDFYLGDFRTPGKELREKGINRIGNIFVSNNRYVEFEKFFQEILEEVYQEHKSLGKSVSASELIWKMGEKINDERSVLYWAWKNKVRIHCPALLDGAIGDNIYFFKFKHGDFVLDVAEDIKWFNDTTLGLKKSGIIVLGSGVVKHCILNANMLRNGADYAVYINNAQEFDGSDAGALPDEAISWGKILPGADSVKVFGDATILFPLVVAETFAK
ncbi:deoxyhypusine synthase [Candidatus Pacearchaeota archaeon CG10_big_fil_rev_8_21_14_0_10_34_12]|nr:MAG: deoxyhypusine synthase [Candidatus Pacearchaeota archaeon CG10_big_fil_rev_8_21_14_0_10_34_12]